MNYPLHLCHPDAGKSCGACCGLYNWSDHSRATLDSLLQTRTALFLSSGKDIEKYRSQPPSPLKNPKLLADIYNCEFLGFIDGGKRRVGCLLHHTPVRDGAAKESVSYCTLSARSKIATEPAAIAGAV